MIWVQVLPLRGIAHLDPSAVAQVLVCCGTGLPRRLHLQAEPMFLLFGHLAARRAAALQSGPDAVCSHPHYPAAT
jgi:hypothetical protein